MWIGPLRQDQGPTFSLREGWTRLIAEALFINVAPQFFRQVHEIRKPMLAADQIQGHRMGMKVERH